MPSLTRTYKSRIYNVTNPAETSAFQSSLTEETSEIPTEFSTFSEETSSNSTEPLLETHSSTVTYNSSTENLDTVWTTESPVTVQSTDGTTTLGNITETNSNSHTTNSTPILPLTDQPSDFTTAAMEDGKSVCIRTSSLTDAEVLAIAIGAVFLTIILSALLYQLVAFMSKKNVNMGSSIFIIENELTKHDLEANGLQPETKL
ncbi:uncharacterized protein [Hyperolius riggenbachi]